MFPQIPLIYVMNKDTPKVIRNFIKSVKNARKKGIDLPPFITPKYYNYINREHYELYSIYHDIYCCYTLYYNYKPNPTKSDPYVFSINSFIYMCNKYFYKSPEWIKPQIRLVSGEGWRNFITGGPSELSKMYYEELKEYSFTPSQRHGVCRMKFNVLSEIGMYIFPMIMWGGLWKWLEDSINCQKLKYNFIKEPVVWITVIGPMRNKRIQLKEFKLIGIEEETIVEIPYLNIEESEIRIFPLPTRLFKLSEEQKKMGYWWKPWLR